MLQVALSFLAGVYVGTEYECGPYLEEIKKAASRLEKKKAEPEQPTATPTAQPTAKGWLSWGSKADDSKKEKDK